MNLTNQEMDLYSQALSKISAKVTGKFAYAVARNIRKMTSELIEYTKAKDDAIIKYGTQNEHGQFVIQIGSEGYKNYLEDIAEIQKLTTDVDIVKVSVSDIEKSDLNAQEILSIDFMIEDEHAEEDGH